MTREATLCQNILNALRIFAQISKLRRFHETKQTQIEVERFKYNLTEFVFEYFCDSRRILATFAKFCLNSLFMIVLLPKSQTRHPARIRAPFPLPHRFVDEKSFYKIFPLLPIVIAKSCQNASGISSRHVVFLRRLGDLVSARKTANRGRCL